MKDKRAKAREHSLYEAILNLKSAAECEAFFTDLCTPKEILALGERWQIAQILDKGELSYRDISASTGASTTTVGRVARFLQQEDYGGYRLILERMKQQNKNAEKRG